MKYTGFVDGINIKKVLLGLIFFVISFFNFFYYVVLYIVITNKNNYILKSNEWITISVDVVTKILFVYIRGNQ